MIIEKRRCGLLQYEKIFYWCGYYENYYYCENLMWLLRSRNIIYENFLTLIGLYLLQSF